MACGGWMVLRWWLDGLDGSLLLVVLLWWVSADVGEERVSDKSNGERKAILKK